MRKKLQAGLAALSIMAIPAAAWTQVSITAQVDRNQVALNDQITLTVDVSGPNTSLPDPQIPPLPDFNVYSSGRSQNISIVNGQALSSLEYIYVLVPRFVGKGVIPPITLTYSGHTARTNPIPIEVAGQAAAAATQPSAAAAQPAQSQPEAQAQGGSGGAPDFFVTAELDKAKAYVDEQVTLTVKFYDSVALAGNPQYEPPDLSGFMKEDLPLIRHANAQFRGRAYNVSEIKTAIFPERDGRLVIGPASVQCPVSSAQAMDPFSPNFFSQFIAQNFGAPQVKEVSTSALKLLAVSLPSAGRPQNFSGAVGHFSISASLDKNQTEAGGALNLSVVIKGQGNLQAMGDPQMPAMPDFRTYETASSLDTSNHADVIAGSKTYKTIIIPRVSGTLSVPSIAFSYFDPERGAYETVRTAPISVRVKPGASEQNAGLSFAGAAQAPGLTEISQDIRYLKSGPQSSPISELIQKLGRGGPINAVPFIFFVACLFWREAQRRRLADPRRLRARQACKAALSLIENASAQASADPKKSADLLGEAFCGYLADKIGAPPAGLTLKRAQELLKERYPGLSAQTSEKIRTVWEGLDLRRFAPSAPADGNELGAAELAEFIETLDKDLRA